MICAVCVVIAIASVKPPLTAPLSPDDIIRATLLHAREAGSYRLNATVRQTLLTRGDADPRFAVANPRRQDTLSYAIDGVAQDAFHMRLSLHSGITGDSGSANPNGMARDMLIADGETYVRTGDTWTLQPNEGSVSGLIGDGLALVALARNARLLPALEHTGIRFERIGFALHSVDVAQWLYEQRGEDIVTARTLAQSQQRVRYEGEGELWLGTDGLPAHLQLRMTLEQGGATAYQADVLTDADYQDFGARFDARLFDPSIAPVSFNDRAPLNLTIPGAAGGQSLVLRASATQLMRYGVLAGGSVFVILALLFVALNGNRRRRMVHVVLLVALISPYTTELRATAASALPAPTRDNADLTSTLKTARELTGRTRENQFAPGAQSQLSDASDEDGDGLPNGYEIQYGTNPFAADTDLDGLTDREEIVGKTCARMAGDPNPFLVITDPLNPDSNSDGIRDGDEFDPRHGCGAGDRPNAWNDDNDSDGVPDALDLSPFSASGLLGKVTSTGATPRAPGANLTFDLLATPPVATVAFDKLFYLDLQVRPSDAEALRYAYKKNALWWPQGDTEGSIRTLRNFDSGRMELAPFLEIRVPASQSPLPQYLAEYGVSISNVISDCAVDCEQKITLPLAPVERNGLTYAYQARMLYGVLQSQQHIRLEDLRLKWAVRGDFGRPNGSGGVTYAPQVVMVYDEGYTLTGAQVQLQGGAQSLVAAPVPTIEQGDNSTLGAAAMLRAGLEARFLSGAITISDIQQRFDLGSTAPITDRWGLTYTYRVASQVTFRHLDQMLLSTAVTLTKSALDLAYPTRAVTPTLVIATEQRTATINLDENGSLNGGEISFNMCGTPLLTSRSLKLSTYGWNPNADNGAALNMLRVPTDGSPLPSRAPASLGAWYPLAYDQLIRWVDDNYGTVMRTANEYIGKATDYYVAGQTALRLIIYAWHAGVNTVQSLGDITWNDIGNTITDVDLYSRIANWLGARGYLPSQFVTVVDFIVGMANAGGPAAWLEKQLNTALTVVDVAGKVINGSTLTFSMNSLASVGQGLANLTLGDLMNFTRTAIGVLNYVALLLGSNTAADVARVLGVVLDIAQKAKAVYDAVNAGILAAQTGVSGALKAAASQLNSIARPMAMAGLILSIATTLFGLFMQISLGNMSAVQITGLVIAATWEIVKTVVLFVVASFFPIGTIIAAAYAIIQGIVSLFSGVARDVANWVLDPISAFFDAVNPDPEQLTFMLGSPTTQGLRIGTYPDHPLGTLVEDEPFYAEVTGTVRLFGATAPLWRSNADFELGRHADGARFELCDRQLDQFLFGELSSDPLAPRDWTRYAGASRNYKNQLCKTVQLPTQSGWSYRTANTVIKSGVYVTSTFTLVQNGGTAPQLLNPGLLVRDFTTRSRLDIMPKVPAINGVVSLDFNFDISYAYQDCGIFGLDCDANTERTSTPPSQQQVYFDVLPATVSDLWHWRALTNYDVDGDGVTGYFYGPLSTPSGMDIGTCTGIVYIPNTEANPDSDHDGVSDKAERERGTNPCLADTDSDSLLDGDELNVGTDPRNADTDGDGLRDGDEVAQWVLGQSTLTIGNRWLVQMEGSYPGLPQPQAFPNPRQANFDGDHRSDSREKARFSSPNAVTPIAVGEVLDVFIDQSYLRGGGTQIVVSTPRWVNDEAAGLTPTLSISLPAGFTNLSVIASLVPETGNGTNDNGVIVVGSSVASETLYTGAMPPLTLGRFARFVISGTPQVTGLYTLTAQLNYSEAGVKRSSLTQSELLINRSGPVVTLTQPLPGTLLPSGAFEFRGIAADPQGMDHTEVCITSAPPCQPADWHNVGMDFDWQTTWTPPTSGHYAWFGRAWDGYGVAGPVAGPVEFDVDLIQPVSVAFDLRGTTYLSTALTDGAPMITLTGRMTDTTGAFASGAGAALIIVQGAFTQSNISPVATPGALSSAFASPWTLPLGPGGFAALAAQKGYTLSASGIDRAGNTGGSSNSLRVIVDDYAPMVRVNVPQTLDPAQTGEALTLSGRADDQAIIYAIQNRVPFSGVKSLADSNTHLTWGGEGSDAERAIVVGDVNGDTLDDVAMVDVGFSLKVGLFFGRAGGLSASLVMADADVTLIGNTTAYNAARTVAQSTGAAGDLNGDGVGDLVIGDAGDGTAFILLGRRSPVGGLWKQTMDLNTDSSFIIKPGNATQYGGSVAFAGDVDGDGLADLLVGARNTENGVDTAALLLGRERGAPTLVTQMYGSICNACAGYHPSLAGLGDINGDGLSDMAIAINHGKVALLYGRAHNDWPVTMTLDAPGSADAWFAGVNNLDGLVLNVAAAGDVNGDGLHDVLISGDTNVDEGRLYVVFGRNSTNPYPAPPASLQPDASFRSVGYLTRFSGITALGDLDRDGKADFAFGWTDNLISFAGIVLAKSMPLQLDIPIDVVTIGLANTTYVQHVGAYVSSGDVNGDGARDILVGSLGVAHLFLGDNPRREVSGIAIVELGLSGPIPANSSLPPLATLPLTWQTAPLLDATGLPVATWRTDINTTGLSDGDFRVYVRATDRAGNVIGTAGWYVGDVTLHRNPVALILNGGITALTTTVSGASATITLTGNLTATPAQNPQYVRVFDGAHWYRMPGVAADWTSVSDIPRADLRTYTMRLVARDAYGGRDHILQTHALDALVAAPQLSANLPMTWHTDLQPTLVVSWPIVSDASGVTAYFAAIDTVSNTVPVDVNVSHAISQTLLDPGVYYAHVRVVDGAGNGRVSHLGPFLVNRNATPSVIHVDGQLDFEGGVASDHGEYPYTSNLNYDPYAPDNPSALYGTWNANWLYLAHNLANWNGPNSFSANSFAVYLDSRVGGGSNTLAIGESVHTMPFDADFAMLFRDGTHTLYENNAGSWSPISSPSSYADVGAGTEMAFDRTELGATGNAPIAVIAYTYNDQGVHTVLPAGARPTVTTYLSGSVTFVGLPQGGAFSPLVLGTPASGAYPVLYTGFFGQVIEPLVSVQPLGYTTLLPGQASVINVTIQNPDAWGYLIPMTVTLGDAGAEQLMQIMSVNGASCAACPAGGREWRVNIETSNTRLISFTLAALTPTVQGVYTVPVSVQVGQWGLPIAPHLPVTVDYIVENAVSSADFAFTSPFAAFKPGVAKLGMLVDSFGSVCYQRLSVDTGSGWRTVSGFGTGAVVTNTLAPSETQEWRLRVERLDGAVQSAIVTRTVHADMSAPQTTVDLAGALSGTLVYLTGGVSDNFGIGRVMVSLNAGPFRPALVRIGAPPVATLSRLAASASWILPADLGSRDGETVTITARTTDEAGNVGASVSITTVVDTVAPNFTILKSGTLLSGIAVDGSGVVTLAVSLNDGVSTIPAHFTNGTWSFDLRDWVGPREPYALVRATDKFGNVAIKVVKLTVTYKTYIPRVVRGP